MLFQPHKDFTRFKKRRNRLVELIKQILPHLDNGVIIMMGGCEGERQSFRQDSSFYYFTGITEPAAAIMIFLDGRDHVYLPNFGKEREKWVSVGLHLSSNPADVCVNKIVPLSEQAPGYSYGKKFKQEGYTNFLRDVAALDLPIFGEFVMHTDGVDQEYFFSHVQQYVPSLGNVKHDISHLIHSLRRIKDDDEIELLYKAVQITNAAQEKAAQVIRPGVWEHEVQAALEYVFTVVAGARPSFPSIVATGKNSTVLHYTDRNTQINDGDLVVVDIGAEYGYYAADLTRTYPANGQFTARQREIYQAVLDTQSYIATVAKPGMFLRNPQQKEQSLHWLATRYLEDRGLARYFPHGLGHYLGLDVHDVGDYTVPLQPGDVFTIEPGVYIPEESLGVRIEDDYLMTDGGAVCLSEDLPKDIEAIEQMMKS